VARADEADRAGHLMHIVARRLGDDAVLGVHKDGDEDVFVVDRAQMLPLLSFLRDDRDAGLDMLVDLTAIDPPDPVSEPTDADLDGRQPMPALASKNRGLETRFIVVVRLRSTRLGYRARIECGLPKDDPTFPSLTSLYPAADWLEREVHDLFGLFPDGHPFVRRLILYPGFAGHPLRRDYPLHKGQPVVPLREPVRVARVVDASTTFEKKS
jgi:NADH-quinone oxidoreductase subunit C